MELAVNLALIPDLANVNTMAEEIVLVVMFEKCDNPSGESVHEMEIVVRLGTQYPNHYFTVEKVLQGASPLLYAVWTA